MAEGGRVFKINALLCFVLHSHKRQSLKTIRSTVKDFYQTEIISEAKDLLLCDFEALKPDKWIRPPMRRGENKVKHDLDDILSTVTFLDEKIYLSKIPIYATDNLDIVPMFRMERGEFAILISKLD